MSDVERRKVQHNRPIRARDQFRSEWREGSRYYIGELIMSHIWPDELIRSCVSCAHFREKDVYCEKFNATPPPKIIAFGCDEYYDEAEIPF